jgi:WD40 repeat protein
MTVALGDANQHGVEIALWDFESGALKRVLAGHTRGERSSFYVHALAFAPDGKTLASGGGAAEEHGEVLLWDMDTGQIKQRLKAGKHYVKSIAFSPDGKTLAAFTIGDAKVRFYDTATGKLQRELKLTGSSFPAHVAFSRDLKLLASGDDQRARIQLWDADTGGLRRSFTSDDNWSIYAFNLSPDGNMLAAHGGHLWDRASGKVLNKLRGLEDTDGVWEFSPDSRLLAFPLKKGGIALWDVAAGKVVRELPGEKSVHGMTFTPNGGNLVTSNGSIWDVRTGTLERGLVPHRLELGQAAFSRDGKTLVTRHDPEVAFYNSPKPVYSEVRIWDARSGAMRHLVGGKRFQVSDLALTADGATLATWGKDDKVRFWDVKTGNLRHTLQTTSGEDHVALSPDGNTLVVQGSLIDVKSGRKLYQLHGDVSAFSRDGKQIATAGHWEVNIWNAASGERVRQLFRDESKKRNPYNGETIDALRFSPDGKSLAVFVYISGGMTPRGRLEVWDVTGTAGKPVRVHGGAYWRMSSLDPRHVFVDSLDIWSVKPAPPEPGGSERWQTRQVPQGRAFAFSPDGKVIVTGDAGPEVKVWDAATLKQRATLLPLPIALGKSPWTDWVTYTPRGFFIGSANSPFMQWRVGHQLLPAEHFDLLRRRPDLVEKALDGEEIAPIFDPQDSRIRGFVDFLGKAEMKFEHDASSKTGLWRIVEPRFPGGTVRVGICSFTQSATEAQMRDALSESGWGWRHFNLPARLAMTTIVTEGFHKGKPDELARLQESLRHAFFWHGRGQTFPLKNGLSNEVLNAGLNPKDKRIIALVAYLGRNGIKLVHDKELGHWRILEPKHDDGWLTVSIRSFPPSASEEQMRYALANINLAYEPNVFAKLGMSHIGTWDSKGAPLPRGLGARLWRLFHDYRPAEDGWKKSDDGLLAVHFSVTPLRVKPDEPIEATVKMRNLSDKPITIKRPFPWPGYWLAGIRGPKGNLGRHGEPPPRMEERWWRVGGALATLQPGAEFKDSVRLEWRNYPDLRNSGTYVFSYGFSYNNANDLERRANVKLWQGQVESLSVNVEVLGGDRPKLRNKK